MTYALNHRREVMNYPLTETCTFSVRCDPPYESEDGGSDETITTCAHTEVQRTLADLVLSNLTRLAPGQTPMIIEVRRTS